MTPDKMRSTLKLTEGMYNQTKKPRPTGKPATPASNDIFIDRSMESPDKVAITLKGRTALITAERARAMIQKLEKLLGELENDHTSDNSS